MSKLRDLLHAYERTIVVTTLNRNDGDREKTCEALGITQRGLQKIMRRHHLLKRRFTQVLPIPPAEIKSDGS
jgi:DNA-binding NtrC family response regulator